MLLPFKRILITAWLLLSSALALDITLDRIDRGVIDLSIGDITIHAPASCLSLIMLSLQLLVISKLNLVLDFISV